MRAVENGVCILQASKEWGVPVTTLWSHVFGETTTSKKGRAGVLTKKRSTRCLMHFIVKMASIGHPLSLGQLRLKVAKVTQTRPTSMVRWLPEMELGEVIQNSASRAGLEVAQGLTESCKRLVSHQHEELVRQL